MSKKIHLPHNWKHGALGLGNAAKSKPTDTKSTNQKASKKKRKTAEKSRRKNRRK